MTYPGGKNGAGTYQKLINLMPPHEVYIEPFLGSGAVMRLKRPARLNIGIDLVGSQLPAVAAGLVAGGAAAGSIAVDDGARGWSLRRMEREAARLAESGVRRRSSLPAMAAAIAESGVEDLHAVSGDGIRYRLFRGCAIAYLELAAPKLTMEACVYCDPPYLRSTRKGRDLYEHEMSDVDHRRLLRVLRKLPCMVMLSGYWSSLYAEMLEGWNTLQFQAMTRGGLATETVWYNFPTPVALHDYRYLGTGFRERERIKRKKQRWVNRLGRMPVLERQALFAALETVSLDRASSD